eukprot:767689-Hanusia_phi.AAC.6
MARRAIAFILLPCSLCLLPPLPQLSPRLLPCLLPHLSLRQISSNVKIVARSFEDRNVPLFSSTRPQGYQSSSKSDALSKKWLEGENTATYTWSDLLLLDSARQVSIQSRVDVKLMCWRASAKSKHDSQDDNILTEMQWERVLEAQVPVDFKIKLWKSKNMVKGGRWSLDDALLSLDLEFNKQKSQVHTMFAREKPPSTNSPSPMHPLKTSNDFIQEIISTPEDRALKRGSALIAEMKSEQLAPDVKFFNTLIATCVGKNAKRGIQTTLSDPFQVSNPSKTQAVRRAVSRSPSQRWSESAEILQMMKDEGVLPDVVTLNVLLESCVKCSDKGLSRLQNVQKACRLLLTFEVDLNISADVVTFSTILNGCATILKDISDQPRGDLRIVELMHSNLRIVDWALQKMAREGIVPNIVTFVALHEIVLYSLVWAPSNAQFKDQIIEFCMQLSDRMREFQVVPNGFLLNCMLKSIVVISKFQTERKYAHLVDKMISFALSQGVRPDVVSYNILLQSLLNVRNSKVSTRHASIRRVQDLAIKIYRHILSQQGVTPDVVTFATFFNLCSSISANHVEYLANAVEILKIMRVLHVKPNAAATSAFITGYCLAKAKIRRPDTLPSSQDLPALVFKNSNRDEDFPSWILKCMVSLNMKPSVATLSNLVLACSHSSSSPRSSIARGLQAMAFLAGKGAKPSRTWYVDLMKLAVNLNQVLYIAAQLRSCGLCLTILRY